MVMASGLACEMLGRGTDRLGGMELLFSDDGAEFPRIIQKKAQDAQDAQLSDLLRSQRVIGDET